MNKIFKIVFNAARGKMMVVNEATSSVQTGKKAAVTVAVVAALAAGTAMAAETVVTPGDYIGEEITVGSGGAAFGYKAAGEDVSVTIADSNFKNWAVHNTAKNGTVYGAAVSVQDASSVSLTNVTIENNEAIAAWKTSAVQGVGYRQQGGSLDAKNLTVKGNVADGDTMGGGVSLIDVSSGTIENLTVSDNSIVNNIANTVANFGTAVGAGLSAAYRPVNLTVTDATFENNTIDSQYAYGGAVYIESYSTGDGASNIEFDKLSVKGNRAEGSGLGVGGGFAIFQEETQVTIKDSVFEGNVANDYGGAIYNSGTLAFSGTNTFTDNTADNGNDIYNEGTIIIKDGKTTFNSGIVNDGTLQLSDKAELVLGVDTTMTGTLVTKKGSAITLADDVTLSFNSKTNNSKSAGVVENLIIQGNGHVDITADGIGSALGIGTNTLDVSSVNIDTDGRGITAYGTNTVTADTITINTDSDGIHAMGDANGAVKLTADTISVTAGAGSYAIQNASANKKENVVVNGKDVTLTSDGRTAVSQQGAGSTVITAENLVIEGFKEGYDSKTNAVNVAAGTLSLTGTETVSISNGQGGENTNAIGIEAAGTLNVTGANVTVNGNIQNFGTLTVDGNATFASDVYVVDGKVTVAGDLTVGNKFEQDGDSVTTIGGNVTVADEFEIESGTVNLNGEENVIKGHFDVEGELYAKGSVIAQTMSVSETKAVIDNSLTVEGLLEVAYSELSVGSEVAVNTFGDIVAAGSRIDVTGAMNTVGDLTLYGGGNGHEVTFTGNNTVGSIWITEDRHPDEVDGASTYSSSSASSVINFNGNTSIGGDFFQGDANSITTIGGNLTVDGMYDNYGSVTVAGNATVTDTFDNYATSTFEGNANLFDLYNGDGATMTVAGNLVVEDDLMNADDFLAEGKATLDISGSATVGGAFLQGGDSATTIGGALAVAGDVQNFGSVTVGGDVAVEGAMNNGTYEFEGESVVNISGAATVGGDFYQGGVNAMTTIGGNATFAGAVDVDQGILNLNGEANVVKGDLVVDGELNSKGALTAQTMLVEDGKVAVNKALTVEKGLELIGAELAAGSMTVGGEFTLAGSEATIGNETAVNTFGDVTVAASGLEVVGATNTVGDMTVSGASVVSFTGNNTVASLTVVEPMARTFALRSASPIISFNGNTTIEGTTDAPNLNVEGSITHVGSVNTGNYNAEGATITLNGDENNLGNLNADGSTINPAAGSTTNIDSFSGADNTINLSSVDTQLTVGEDTAEGTTITATGDMNDAMGGDLGKLMDQVGGLSGEYVAAAGDVFGETTGTVEDGKLTDVEVKKHETNAQIADLSTAVPAMIARVETNDLRKRLGDIRSAEGTHGAWARYDGGKFSGASGFENTFNKVQVGIDTVPEVGAPRFGVAFSYAKGDVDMTGASADMQSYSLAAYGVWMGESGQFVDVIGRMGTVKSDLMTNTYNEKLDQVVLSLSGEFGWRFDVTDQFYVEPSVEATYTYVNSDSYAANGNTFKVDSYDSMVARAGFAAGFKCPSNFGEVYVRAGVAHEFMGDAKFVATNAYGMSNPIEVKGEDTWFEYAVGANFNVNKNTYVYADIERTEGADVETDWRANIGVRFAF